MPFTEEKCFEIPGFLPDAFDDQLLKFPFSRGETGTHFYVADLMWC
jgi:hypothetical protein